MYGHWLDGISNMFSTLIWVGASALLWSLWLCRNDCISNGKIYSPMQVIYCCPHWLRTWSTLHRTEYQSLFKAVCMRLERVASEVFTQHGWHHNLWIGPPSHMALLLPLCCFYILSLTIHVMVVCILAMQRLGVALYALYLLDATFWVNKSILFEKSSRESWPRSRSSVEVMGCCI